MEQYKMTRTHEMANIKVLKGQVVRVVAQAQHDYTDSEGELHHVLAVKLDDGRYFRTETAAFIEAFNSYWDFFADDEQKPEILISCKRSRKGNDFVTFDVVE